MSTRGAAEGEITHEKEQNQESGWLELDAQKVRPGPASQPTINAPETACLSQLCTISTPHKRTKTLINHTPNPPASLAKPADETPASSSQNQATHQKSHATGVLYVIAEIIVVFVVME